MNVTNLIIFVLFGLLGLISVLYFVVAYGEYTDWMELLEFGITSETTEKIVEIMLFLISGIIYIGLIIWILKVRTNQKIPYVICISISAVLIFIYIASRTVGVPIVGTEFYIGRLDWISKIVQVLIIGLSGLVLYKISKHVPTQNKTFLSKYKFRDLPKE
ncbi:hypothetical protein YTPLAS21_18590 [Candidatus Nitrosocosmicus sp.]|nr:hypothetical protein YTPLAS21_18590 [Candidatus Nitrosocosmicus sp.]